MWLMEVATRYVVLRSTDSKKPRIQVLCSEDFPVRKHCSTFLVQVLLSTCFILILLNYQKLFKIHGAINHPNTPTVFWRQTWRWIGCTIYEWSKICCEKVAWHRELLLLLREHYQHVMRTHLPSIFRRVKKYMEWIELLPPLGRLQWAFPVQSNHPIRWIISMSYKSTDTILLWEKNAVS